MLSEWFLGCIQEHERLCSSGMGGGHHVFIRKKCGEGNTAADMDFTNSVCPNVRERQSCVARVGGSM